MGIRTDVHVLQPQREPDKPFLRRLMSNFQHTHACSTSTEPYHQSNSSHRSINTVCSFGDISYRGDLAVRVTLRPGTRLDIKSTKGQRNQLGRPCTQSHRDHSPIRLPLSISAHAILLSPPPPVLLLLLPVLPL